MQPRISQTEWKPMRSHDPTPGGTPAPADDVITDLEETGEIHQSGSSRVIKNPGGLPGPRARLGLLVIYRLRLSGPQRWKGGACSSTLEASIFRSIAPIQTYIPILE